jgi:predicted PurR-regulated permease PerM
MPNSLATAEEHDQVLSPEGGAPSQIRVALQLLLIIAGAAFALWALQRLASVVLVLILAALFAYVIAPVVQLAERPIRLAGRPRHLSRGAAIALIYVLMAGGVSGSAVLLLPAATEQVNDMISRAPAYTQSIVTWENGWSRYYEHLRIPIELRQRIDQSVHAGAEAAVGSARQSLMALAGHLSSVPSLVLVPILAFFFLKDAAGFRRTIVIALPYRIRLRGHRLFEELNRTLAAYVRAQLLACLLVGTVCAVGFAAIGVPYPVLLGILAGALEFIPFVGPLVVAVVASIVAALHAPVLVAWTVAFLAALRLVEDYVIYPRLIRRGIALHPLAVIVAVLVGANLAGVAGMFLAVPVAAVVTVAFHHWLEWRTSEAAA